MFDVRLASERSRKTEPERLNAAATRLADQLRDHVTMPADLRDPERSYADTNSGKRLPPVSCAFKNCLWYGGDTPVTRSMREVAIDKASGVYEHPWDFELRAHVLSNHGCEMEDILSRYSVAAYKAWDVYKEALGICERRSVPIAGVSIDRRALEYTLQLYNDEMVRSLICGICARIRLDTGHVHSDIQFVTGAWLQTLEVKHPGIVKKVCSQERFDQLYRQSGMPLAPSGNQGAGDVVTPDFTDWQLWIHAELFQKRSDIVKGLRYLHDGNIPLLCCPEDHECEDGCVEQKRLCRYCRIPICARCREAMYRNEIPAMALMNENWQGYIQQWIYDVTDALNNPYVHVEK
jgi:hypothetical protein